MAIARLADEVLTLLGDFLDDPELCAYACSQRVRWECSTLQRQTRKDEQLLFLQLMGRAECPLDCERAAGLLDRIATYVGECFWGSKWDDRPDVWFHIEFATSRCDISRLHRAVRKLLIGLEDLDDLHVLRETLTFRDEYTGERIFDDGEYNQVDILRRLPQKLARRVPSLKAYPYLYDTWVPIEER